MKKTLLVPALAVPFLLASCGLSSSGSAEDRPEMSAAGSGSEISENAMPQEPMDASGSFAPEGERPEPPTNGSGAMAPGGRKAPPARPGKSPAQGVSVESQTEPSATQGAASETAAPSSYRNEKQADTTTGAS